MIRAALCAAVGLALLAGCDRAYETKLTIHDGGFLYRPQFNIDTSQLPPEWGIRAREFNDKDMNLTYDLDLRHRAMLVRIVLVPTTQPASQPAKPGGIASGQP
ncbi:MAG: hypothetical protein ACE15C_00375 [Phycisphaerae bacterium]